MKSKFAQKFNHDPVADWYDDVKKGNNPIRIGYSDLLHWVSEKIGKSKFVVDLGSGTGNTVDNLSKDIEKIICVDISKNMLNICQR